MKLSEVMRGRKYGRHGRRRRFTECDMAMLKHYQAIVNARVNRGETKLTNNRYIIDCGCGAEGCFIISSY